MAGGSPRSIFITGAASGIGRATARWFAQRGWFVGCYDLDRAGLDALRTELDAPAGARFDVLDVADRHAVERAFRAFGDVTGERLDLLFNNAGITARGPFAAMDWEEIVAVVDVNVVGSISVIHASLPLLRATENSLCLSTSSAASSFGVADIAVYSATKHAIRGLTEALSVELHPFGVRVADVLPALVDTAMLPDSARPDLPERGPWRMLDPDEIAATVWDAYHGDSLHWFVPAELAAIDVQARVDPDAARDDRLESPFT